MASKTSSARKKKPSAKTGGKTRKQRSLKGWLWFLCSRAVLAAVALALFLVLLFTVVNPPVTHTIWAEQRRLGSVERDWVALEDVAPEMARAVVAAEDANFCLHWGFDVEASAGSTAKHSSKSVVAGSNVMLRGAPAIARAYVRAHASCRRRSGATFWNHDCCDAS